MTRWVMCVSPRSIPLRPISSWPGTPCSETASTPAGRLRGGQVGKRLWLVSRTRGRDATPCCSPRLREADPGEPAEVEISVLPQYRRRGVGRALARAVRERLTGRAEAAQAETYSEAGVEFGRALGMQVGNTEQRLLLDLPVDLQKLRAKHGRARGDRARGDGARGVEVQSWVGACPEEVLEDWTRLSMQMEADVPMGDLTRPAPRTDLDSVRLDERRMEEQGWLLVRSIA